LQAIVHAGRRNRLTGRQVNEAQDRGIFDPLIALNLKAGELEGLRLGGA